MDVPRGGMQTHQVWTVKKYILGSGHNSLGGPMMLDISPARIGRRFVGQVCGDAKTYSQHHDAVQFFSDRSHVGDPSVNTPAETECVCRRSWLCCPCDAASFAKAGFAEQEASEGQSRWGRQLQKVCDGAQRRRGWCGRRRFVHRSLGPVQIRSALRSHDL